MLQLIVSDNKHSFFKNSLIIYELFKVSLLAEEYEENDPPKSYEKIEEESFCNRFVPKLKYSVEKIIQMVCFVHYSISVLKVMQHTTKKVVKTQILQKQDVQAAENVFKMNRRFKL